MNRMFNNCLSLSIANFSNFKSNGIEEMDYMFSKCKNILSFDFSNFQSNDSDSDLYENEIYV